MCSTLTTDTVVIFDMNNVQSFRFAQAVKALNRPCYIILDDTRDFELFDKVLKMSVNKYLDRYFIL